MPNEQNAGSPAMERLQPFIGEWSIEATFPAAGPAGAHGHVSFEWMLGGQYLVERAEVRHPDAPDSVAIIGADQSGAGYSQHYFDSRGVARVYAMTFDAGIWTLVRDTPDFSPLSFWQRFRGPFSTDGNIIRGMWEASTDEGATWEKDFDLTFTRLA